MSFAPGARAEGGTAWHVRFRLDETTDEGVQRILGELTSEMIGFLDNPASIGADTAIHEVRKRGKQVRALLRLVRPAIDGDFKAIDRSYRDTGRLLAPARDARIVVDTFDELFAPEPPATSEVAPQAVRSMIEGRAIVETAAVFQTPNGPAIEAKQLLDAGRRDASTLRVREHAPSIADGGSRTYAQCRAAFQRLATEPTPEAFHRWRIRVKQRRHQIAFLSDCAPPEVSDTHESLHQLSDLLGAAHDLVVLRAHLEAARGVAPADEIRRTLTAADRRRGDLESQALVLGTDLFGAPPEQMHRSLVAIWETWDRMRG